MNLIVSSHGLELTPSLRAYAEDKIGAVADKFKDVVHDVKILLSIDAGQGKEPVHKAQVTARVGTSQSNTSLRHLEHACADLYAAIDILCSKVHREASNRKIMRQHKRGRSHRHEHPMA
jgi:ribosomal subunit interface protein